MSGGIEDALAEQSRDLRAEVNAQPEERRQPWALREIAIELGQQAAAADLFRLILEQLVSEPTTSRRFKALQAAARDALRAHPARRPG